MGLNYFEISKVKNENAPLCLSKDGKVRKCVFLLTKIPGSDDYCYTEISNSWLTLDKLDNFKVIDHFNQKN